MAYLGRSPINVQAVIQGNTYERRLATGALAIVPSGSESEWRWRSAPPEQESLHLYLSPDVVGGTVSAEGIDPARVALTGDLGHRDDRIEQLAMALLAGVRAAGPGGRIYAESLATALGVHLVRRHSTAGAAMIVDRGGGLPPRALARVVDYIEAHLAADLSLSALAATAGLSPHHFAKLFKVSTGQSPHRFVIARRVERAKFLLGHGDAPIAEIAAEVGFADQSHLTLHMARSTGLTPRGLRRRHQNVP